MKKILKIMNGNVEIEFEVLSLRKVGSVEERLEVKWVKNKEGIVG